MTDGVNHVSVRQITDGCVAGSNNVSSLNLGKKEQQFAKRIVELGAVFYLNPQPRLDPRKNQNGTLAKDALLMEKFISAECVR